MKRWVAGCAAVVVLCSASLRADVTIAQTLTMEGQALAAMGKTFAPRLMLRVKGTKARTDVEMNGVSVVTLADQATGTVITLNPADRTARVLEPPAPGAEAAAPAAASKPEVSVKPTGQKRTIDGVDCDEYAMSMTLSLAEMGLTGMQVPPEAAAAMKGVNIAMSGTTCIAKGGPGIAEYMTYQKSAGSTLKATIAGGLPGMNAGTLDRLMDAASATPGLAYLTEIVMSFEGSGQFVAMMQQLGTMKMTNKVTSVSVDPIADDLFTVPADYKIVK